MKSFAAKFFTLLFLTLVITAVMPKSAQARPTIKFRVEHVYLHEAGEAEIVGYFENVGDQDAYVKWTDIDLKLFADNGQEMWSDYGIRHYVEDVYVPAHEYVAYTCYIQHPDIPEYHGKYRFRSHTVTHWEKSAG